MTAICRDNSTLNGLTDAPTTPLRGPKQPNPGASVKNGAVPRLALTKTEAAATLGISVDSFERYVQPELRIVRAGSLRLVPVRELERWLERNAALAVGE